jgi:hypothetical protein
MPGRRMKCFKKCHSEFSGGADTFILCRSKGNSLSLSLSLSLFLPVSLPPFSEMSDTDNEKVESQTMPFTGKEFCYFLK